MQEKFNIILWIFIPCIFAFFIFLSFENKENMKRYELAWKIEDEAVKVTIFDTGTKDWDRILQDIQKKYQKVENEVDFMSEIKQELNVKSYMIQINESVTVGTRYRDQKYQVATTDKNGNLFQIIELEQQLFTTKEVTTDEFDKVLMITKTPNQAKILLEELPNLSLEAGKKLVLSMPDTEVYWLQGTKEAAHIKGKQK